MIVLNILLLLGAIVVAIPAAMFCLEVILAVIRRPNITENDHDEVPSFAVLIPAHNEQAVIGRTLATLLPTVPSQGRVVVVADNCTDGTAAVAREHGATTVERFETSRRGKGWALDFGLASLTTNPPEVVVFLDADCQVDPHTVTRLARAARQTGCPVQGLNLCDPDPRGGALQAVSGLAFRFKNLVRPLGLTRLAGLTHLTGTGMAIPWARIDRSQLASGNVVEDMQLGIDLAVAGYRTRFVPSARVNSPLPQQRAAAKTQRTRWEHGHLRTLLTQVPKLIARALKTRRVDLLLLAFDLAIPPLSLLVMTTVAYTALALLALLAGADTLPAVIAATSLLAIAGCVLLGWGVYCRQQVPLTALLMAPWYACWKIPLYLAFLWQREQRWVRTARDASAS